MVHNEMLIESQFVTSSFALIDRANTNTDELFVLMPPEQLARSSLYSTFLKSRMACGVEASRQRL